MDRQKAEVLITENMKNIFGFSLTRVTNVTEAEELASEITYRLVKALPRLKDDTRFYGFLWKIAENTYVDHLRKRKNANDSLTNLDDTFTDGTSVENDLLQKEDLRLLRRELGLLSAQYRKVTVLYYMEGFSCARIAEICGISTEMVKYYLFRARKIIQEGMNMERIYGEKSYHPKQFEIDFWGTKAGDDREYQDFQKRKIKGNILLAAYYAPLTGQELSMELGVALPYLEDELALLLKKQYLIEKNGKYLTNIPIFTPECTDAINRKLAVHIEQAANDFIAVTDKFAERFGQRVANENLMRWQKVLLCLHFALLETEADDHGELPSGGPYSLINGGGGRGIIWGRSRGAEENLAIPQGINGIYNGAQDENGRGTVIAMNFKQNLASQRFVINQVTPVVSAAVGELSRLSEKTKAALHDLGYIKEETPNFPVYSVTEYEEIKQLLHDSTEIVTALNTKTMALAAEITADLAPAHIRKTAAYTGSSVYRFHAIDRFADALFAMGWLKPTDQTEKPTLCVIKK